jgi:hypothetical protein
MHYFLDRIGLRNYGIFLALAGTVLLVLRIRKLSVEAAHAPIFTRRYGISIDWPPSVSTGVCKT